MTPATSHHRKHHRVNNWLPRISECYRCTEDRLNCENKIVYKSRKLADKKAERINIEAEWRLGMCKRAYRCRWCAFWHLTSEATELDYIRIDKMRRKWMRRTHQKYDNDYVGWDNDTESGGWDIPA